MCSEGRYSWDRCGSALHQRDHIGKQQSSAERIAPKGDSICWIRGLHRSNVMLDSERNRPAWLHLISQELPHRFPSVFEVKPTKEPATDHAIEKRLQAMGTASFYAAKKPVVCRVFHCHSVQLDRALASQTHMILQPEVH